MFKLTPKCLSLRPVFLLLAVGATALLKLVHDKLVCQQHEVIADTVGPEEESFRKFLPNESMIINRGNLPRCRQILDILDRIVLPGLVSGSHSAFGCPGYRHNQWPVLIDCLFFN